MKEDSLAMAKYKIIYDRSNCTGVAACHIVAKKFWQMNKDDKADLISSIPVGNDIWEREIDEKDLPENLEAARNCPVSVIKIFDESNNEIK